MTETPLQHLWQQLQHHHPDTVLVASDHVPPLIQQWAEDNGAHLTIVNSQQHDWRNLGRYDFTIVADYLEHLHKSEARQKLAQLRNLHSQRIWVLVSKAGPWTFGDFIGLGFRRYGEFDSNREFDNDAEYAPTVCYGYDLASYNRVRSWNNPRFWANPENWNKYRW